MVFASDNFYRPNPTGGMSSKERRKDKSIKYFRRALRFLWPYRRLVVISIVCAIFVSGAFAGGLGALLPIMRVFLNGDTVQSWIDRVIAQKRIGATFADRNDELELIRPKAVLAAGQAGLRDHEVITLPDAPAGTLGVFQTLHALSDPQRDSLTLKGGATVALPPVPAYLVAGRRIAALFPTDPVRAVAAVLSIILALAVVSNVIAFFQEYLSDKAAVLAVNDVRRQLYDHVLHVPLSHFNLKGTSDVTSRLTQDAQNLNEGFKSVLGQLIQEPIKAAVAFGLALLASWKLTLFIILFAPLMFVIVRKFGKKMRRTSRKAMLSSSSMLGQIEASLLGIRVVKGASAERFERRRYSRIMSNLVSHQLRMSRIDAFTEPTMATLSLIFGSVMVLAASYMLFRTLSLTRDKFTLVMACLLAIADSLRRVSKAWNVVQKSNAAGARIFEVLDLPIERGRRQGQRDEGTEGQSEEPARVKLAPIAREIRFEDLTFSYPGALEPAVVGVSLVVPRGKSVAVVGRNGSGKTTLLALLPRFYEPQSGRILIDDVDIRYATLRSLRAQISIVTQDSVIFPGTIAENIAYGNPLASRDEIIAASKRAFAHDFILEKPQGYDTLLGELGGQLSGGQKQRLCIARAILRKSPILVLDEATSQVDAQSEHLIQQAIQSVMRERTTFVIAHRFSTILNADEIVVMERGQIVGRGKHDDLLAKCETYQQLYERQLFAA
jgi:ABC-type multidrug transport system fused ATPase/permease subunit